MRNKPEEHYMFNYKKSNYDETDYRSCYYRGKWQNKLIDIICKEAEEYNSDFFHYSWKYVNVKHEHMPEKMYKFYSCRSYNLQCINDGKVYLSVPDKLNDPFDCRWGINEYEFIKKYIIEYIKKNRLVEIGEVNKEDYNIIISTNCKEYDESRIWNNRPIDFDDLLSSWYFDESKVTINKIVSEARVFYHNNNKIEEIRDEISLCSFSSLNSNEIEIFLEMWSHYADNHTGFCVEYNLNHIRKQEIDDNKMTVENKGIAD